LHLPGDVGYNVEKEFSSQARVALRLSHFLSNFLQNVDLYEEYGNLRGDRLLNIEQVFGEVCTVRFCMCIYILFISVVGFCFISHLSHPNIVLMRFVY